ncbi:MAG: glycosyltransferase family 1 protein [Alphaproteobacteria bacterium]|nr:glycosyltransferase family 1 protein [Alphaproteobacteria bacterium]
MTAAAAGRARPLIAFFDHADIFEDFYPHYGVTQRDFATRYADTGNHAFLTVLQRAVGDVIWYEMSRAPELDEARHEMVGCRVRFLRATLAHRMLWSAFYLTPGAWRWRGLYHHYAPLAAYLSLLSPRLLAAFRRDRPDAIFAQDYSSGRFEILLLLARLFRIPLIAYHSGSLPEHYAFPRLKMRTIRRADHLIVSSHAERDQLVRRFAVAADRVSVILTPIDTDRFKPASREAACTAERLPGDRRYLLFVGRLENRVKKVDLLLAQFLAIAPRIADVDLLIAGTGPDAHRLQAQAGGSARVRFLGWISDKVRLARLYSVAEALVLPSLSEGFPTVVGEAMACGTPVIASAVGGMPEMVGESTGWLIPPGDGPALRAALLDLLDADAMRSSGLRIAARAWAEERLCPAAIGRRLQECFQKVAARHA